MLEDDAPLTPLRGLTTTEDGGVRVIRDTGATWLDGSEGILLERVRSGLPLDSLSDELFATATSWPERYHLSPSRANVIRSLDLPADATVLEIGAGCGAITRYLGETCAVVDALEPTLARARVAAARTAELPGVTVFSGEVADLPPVPVYDVVVVVGVLEYVGDGGRADAPYVEFLGQLRATLKPGGRLVLAIENSLGVKYLAGAPEDHSGQVFHSVEGYPSDGPARTFNRDRLAELARAAGFADTHVLGAFPDYKLTRMVFDDALLAHARPLAVQVPSFPSPDWVIDRPVLLDEALLWNELVQAGVGGTFANSLVLIATVAGPQGPALWSSTRLGAYFSIRRRRMYQVRKVVEIAEGEVMVTSALLGCGAGDHLRVLPYSEPWREGESVVTRVVAHPEELDARVAQWAEMLEQRATESAQGVPLDVLPHNVQLVDGSAMIIDDEWRSDEVSLTDVIERGAVLLARDLAALKPLATWSVASTAELAERIAEAAGRRLDATMLASALEREAVLQATIGGGEPGSAPFEATRRAVHDELVRQLAHPREGRAAAPVWTLSSERHDEAVEARDLLFATGRQLDVARAELMSLHGEVAALRAAQEATLGARARRLVGVARRLAGRTARAVRTRLPRARA